MSETVNRQLDDLQQRVANLKASVESAERETADQVQARVEKAQADVQAAQDEAAVKAGQASDAASSSWTGLKQDMKARVRALHDRVQMRQRQLDAKVAKGEADWAENDAEDAISFARWAVDNAGIAALSAVKVRLWANAQAAGRS
ncbi:MAG: hypothetical protein ACXWNK_18730 [Vulcanimicrobiaceae bacterium]